MPNASGEREIKLKVNIQSGPADANHKANWRKFWQHMLAKAKGEAAK